MTHTPTESLDIVPSLELLFLCRCSEIPIWHCSRTGASDDLDYFGSPPLTVEQHASYILAVLDHIGVATFSVVGNLFGSFVAASLAASLPDRITKVVLVHPILMTEVDHALVAEARALYFELSLELWTPKPPQQQAIQLAD